MRKGWVVIAGSVNNDSKPWKINGPTVRRDGVHGASPRTVNFISVFLFIPTVLENERDTVGKVSLSAFQIILQIGKLRYS
ncbi:hypothetical protein YC2023_066549 [Brassica napus]